MVAASDENGTGMHLGNGPLVVQRPSHVVVHPLVLLSVVDHYRRAALSTGKRVLGVLLGNWNGQTVNVTNSYAVPFEEDEANPNVWFLDHNYHEGMNELSKKVNARERPVGWYHTGPKLRVSDLAINEVFRKYCTHACPALVIVDPAAAEDRVGLPFDAYAAVDRLMEEGGTAVAGGTEALQKVFVHLPSVVEAEEAEEIGVEHLLRDVKDNVVGDLTTKISNKLDSLRALQQQLTTITDYLKAVQAGTLPPSAAIIYHLQDMFNLLPDVHSVAAVRALTVAANDQATMVFAGSVVRAVIALHELINNKLEDTALQCSVSGGVSSGKEKGKEEPTSVKG